MDRMKTFLKYALWIIGFFILSDFLINVGLNSTYKDIKRIDNNTQINIYQSDATYVNGRIRGVIKNTEDIKEKYIEIELYSKRDILLGRKYIEVNKLKNDEMQAFEVLFKAQDVKSYSINLVDEKKQGAELEIIPKDLTKPEIIVATIITFLIFW